MNQTIIRVASGLAVLLVGVGALLDGLTIINFWETFRTWWPTLLIGAGLLIFLSDMKQYITALAFAVVGGVILLNNLDYVDINLWNVIWPVVIIAIGLSIILNQTGKAHRNIRTQDLDSISAIFSGNDTSNKSQDYKGGKMTAVFGGITIDLRDAVIKDSATIEVFTVCGGIELKVPRNWHVKHSVFPILGGVESKAEGTEKGPTLYINGTVALGGVEIKT